MKRSNGSAPVAEVAHVGVFDGLRGLAVLMVFAFHGTMWTGFEFVYPTWPQKPVVSLQTFATTGFLGVELFFFISGFALYYPFARHVLEGAPRASWLEFAYRRFIKIVPSYLLALLATAYLRRADFTSAAELGRHVLAHATFLHGFWDSTFTSIGGVFWSLAVEVEFYVVFPLIAIAFMRLPLQTWLAVCAVALWHRGSAVADGSYDYMRVALGLPAQLDVFVTGMAAAYLFVRFRPIFQGSRRARALATAGALAALAATIALFQNLADTIAKMRGTLDPSFMWQAQHRFVVALLFLGFALGSAFALSFWRGIVANPPLVWISVISYNLYLWHDTILGLCHKNGFPCALDPAPWTRGGWIEQYFAASVLLSLAVASAVTYGFERPLLRLRPAWIWREASERGRELPAPTAAPPG